MSTLPERRDPVFASLTRPIFELVARSVFRVWCPLRVEGHDRLPALPYIICANHNSHMDSVVLIAATGQPFHRFATFAARDYFFRNALVFAWFSSLVRIIPLERAPSPEAFQRTLARCREFLEHRSRGLILFPEGTRSRTGEVGPFRRGAALFAAELGVPVIPAQIEGTAAALPVGSFFARPGRVTVRFAHPLFPPSPTASRDRESFTNEIRERVLSPEIGAHG